MARPFSPPVAPLTPSAEALRRNTRWLGALGGMTRLGLRRWFDRIELSGAEHLHGGPRVVLLNHSHVMDPLLFTVYAKRPVQFLITEPALFDSLPARLLAGFGQVPKRKLESDTRSIRLLRAWRDVGAAVGIFPEGRFSWDGKPLPLQPGLFHLVHHLDAPVVTVRQVNGDRVWPVWARYPRRTSVRFEVDPPRTFAPGEDLEGYVRARLHLPTPPEARWPVSGKKLAAGLARLLRFCIACGADGSLEDELEDGNTLRCATCRKAWTVDTDNRLHDGAEVFDVGDALNRVFALLRGRWGHAVKLTSVGGVELHDARNTTWQRLGAGSLVLEAGTLRLGEWRFPLSDLLSQTLDWGELLLLRSARGRFALRMAEDSRALWEWALSEALSTQQPLQNVARTG